MGKYFLVDPHFHTRCLGTPRFQGPGENRFSTKRISWSDWEICFPPAPLAQTKSQKHYAGGSRSPGHMWPEHVELGNKRVTC